MNRREFLMTTLAAFALSALPKLTFAETIPVSDAVKHKIDPKNKLGFGFTGLLSYCGSAVSDGGAPAGRTSRAKSA